MQNKRNELRKWLNIYQKAYLVADEESVSKIIVQIVDRLQESALELNRIVGEKSLMEIFEKILTSLERKDYVQIQDILETKIQPLLFDENQ